MTPFGKKASQGGKTSGFDRAIAPAKDNLPGCDQLPRSQRQAIEDGPFLGWIPLGYINLSLSHWCASSRLLNSATDVMLLSSVLGNFTGTATELLFLYSYL